MHADTEAIRAYGAATTDLSGDIRAVAATLTAQSPSTVTDAFGPVGTKFAAALTDATAALRTGLSTCGDDVAASAAASAAAARAFADVEQRAMAQIGRVGH